METSTLSQEDQQGAAAPAVVQWTTGEVADKLGAHLVGPDDLILRRVDTLDRADPQTLTFIRDARHAASWGQSLAAAAIVSDGLEPEGHDSAKRALLLVEDADRAMIGVLEALAPPHVGPEGVHASATIHATAKVAPDAKLGPGAVVGPRSTVGPRTMLHAGAVVGAHAKVGADCDIRAGVVIEDRCTVGDRVAIHPNAVIGADGFGYRPAPGGQGLLKIPHAGNVEIHDDVEIGAGVTIDRGKFGPTVIGQGAKIDNLVQIGHNCRIGRACVICGACGIAGSVTIGDGAVLGGGVGIKDNITIGAKAQIGARSGVMDDIPAGETWVGYPARPARETMKILAATQRLPETLRRLKQSGGPAAAE